MNLDDIDAREIIGFRKITPHEFIGKIECTICMERFEFNTEYATLPCGHIFHEKCLLPWLSQHHSCPICRKEFVSNSESHHQNDSQNDIYQETRNKTNRHVFFFFYSRSITPTEFENHKKCSYCKERLELGNDYIYTCLPCGHLLHQHCLEPILQSRRCPECNQALEK